MFRSFFFQRDNFGKKQKTKKKEKKKGKGYRMSQSTITIKVGKPKFNREDTNLELSESGNIIFGKQSHISIKEFLSGLHRYYPIIPEFKVEEGLQKKIYRYYGYLDLDFETPSPSDAYNKDTLSDELKNPQSFSSLCARFPPMKEVWKIATKCYLALTQKAVAHLTMFFTGFKGVRLLWYDPVLWRRVPVEEKHNAGHEVLSVYLGSEIISEMGKMFDTSVYGRGKGIKPDLLPHPKTQIAPLPLEPMQNSETDPIFQALIGKELHLELGRRIREFWASVANNIPADAATISHIQEKKNSNVRRCLSKPLLPGPESKSELPEAHLSILKKSIEHLGSIGPVEISVVCTSEQYSTVRLNNSYCPIRKSHHSKDSQSVYYIVTGNWVKVGCFKEECRKINPCPMLIWPPSLEAATLSMIHREITTGSANIVRLCLFSLERERIDNRGIEWTYDGKVSNLSTLKSMLWANFYNLMVRYKHDKYPNIPSKLYSNLTSKKLFNPIVSKFLETVKRQSRS